MAFEAEVAIRVPCNKHKTWKKNVKKEPIAAVYV